MSEFTFIDELPGKPYQAFRSPHRFIKPGAQLLIDFADALRDRPMTWAQWPRPLSVKSAGVTSKRLREGFFRAVRPGGGFECCTRDAVLCVRFNPDRVEDDRELAFREGYESGYRRGLSAFHSIIEETSRATQQGLRDAIAELNIPRSGNEIA